MTPRERPILFSGEMVRALLEGRKTQTRRVVKWPKWSDPANPHQVAGLVEHRGIAWFEEGRPVKRYTCPYGVPGDRLWVRESFGLVWPDDCDDGSMDDTAEPTGSRPLKPEEHKVAYKADADGDDLPGGWPNDEGAPEGLRWKPSIHMPRWASRLTLEVTGVKVERVNEITESDARAEGRSLVKGDPAGYFPETWDSINAARGYGWSVNPWCWCLTFRVLR